MSNYDIEIDLAKLKGARVMDVDGEYGTEHGIFLPINNRIGTGTDYCVISGNQAPDSPTYTKRTGVILKAAALGMRTVTRGQTHLLKPHVNKDIFERLTEEQLRRMPWIGNMRPWEK